MIYLSLGSNTGNRIENIVKSSQLITRFAKLRCKSSLYLTKPWGGVKQDNFINCVIGIDTELPPSKLLKLIKEVENEIGRTSSTRWGPREIDIDILLYEDLVMNTSDLVIPHTCLLERDFFLEPLLEIAPGISSPMDCGSLVSCAECLRNSNKSTIIIQVNNPKWNNLATSA